MQSVAGWVCLCEISDKRTADIYNLLLNRGGRHCLLLGYLADLLHGRQLLHQVST